MVTNHLHATYGVYILYLIPKSYDFTAPVRREEKSYGKVIFDTSYVCPLKYLYFLEIAGAGTIYCTVIENKVISTGHRTAHARRSLTWGGAI